MKLIYTMNDQLRFHMVPDLVTPPDVIINDVTGDAYVIRHCMPDATFYHPADVLNFEDDGGSAGGSPEPQSPVMYISVIEGPDAFDRPLPWWPFLLAIAGVVAIVAVLS